MNKFSTRIAAGTLIFLVIAATLILMTSVSGVEAQPQRPTRDGGGLPTRGGASTQTLPNLQVTAALPDRSQDGASSASALATSFAATLDYLSVVASQSAASIQATATAVLAQIQAIPAELQTEIETILEALPEGSSILYDQEMQALTLTLSVDEATVDMAIAVALEAAGYDPSTVEVEFVTNGIVVTVYGVAISEGVTAAVAVEYTLVMTEDGGYTFVLTAASVNGVPVPVSAIDDALTAVIDAAIASAMTGLPEGTLESDLGITYTINDILITEDIIIVSVTVSFAVP